MVIASKKRFCLSQKAKNQNGRKRKSYNTYAHITSELNVIGERTQYPLTSSSRFVQTETSESKTLPPQKLNPYEQGGANGIAHKETNERVIHSIELLLSSQED